jgi:hypothetical protein
MSIKRTKARTYGSGRRSGSGPDFSFGGSSPQEPEKTWEEHVAGKTDEEFAQYSLKSSYDRGALINHTKFGKGIVLKVEDAHVVVLFQDGEKKLGAVPKPASGAPKGPTSKF